MGKAGIVGVRSCGKEKNCGKDGDCEKQGIVIDKGNGGKTELWEKQRIMGE
jgi:hypothetical protein